MSTPPPEAKFSETPEIPVSRNADAGGIREVWTLAYPIVFATISETTLGVVDTFMVSKLGTVAVASVGLGSMMAWLFYLPFLGLAMGINTFVSQYFGAGKATDCGRVTWQGLYIGVVCGLLILSGIPLAPWLFDLARPSPEVREAGVQFLQYRLLDGPGLMNSMTIASFFRGIGDTRTPMKVGITVNLLNIVLNYGLIYGNFGLPRMEIAGSALGSALAGLTGGGIALLLFLRKKQTRFQTRHVPSPTWGECRRVIRVGAPIGLQRFLDIGSFVIFSALIGRLGTAQLAANQISIQLMSVSYMIGLSVGMAATTLVGQYIGAGRLDLAEKSTYSAFKLAISSMVVMGAGFLLFPNQVMGLFNDDPDVIRFGREGLILAAFFQAFDAMAVVFTGALRGAGDTRWTAVAAFIGAWIIFLPLSYTLAFTWQMDFWGAWLGATVYIWILGIACVYRFRQGTWKHMTL